MVDYPLRLLFASPQDPVQFASFFCSVQSGSKEAIPGRALHGELEYEVAHCLLRVFAKTANAFDCAVDSSGCIEQAQAMRGINPVQGAVELRLAVAEKAQLTKSLATWLAAFQAFVERL
ncbi:MAG: hypothetical protein EBV68_12700 [Betaproteobacteria bacterium]|nr:hypothetical protein [Betaproteobacteria bacterium]